jgi:DNA polymerase III alpha subunit
MRLDQYSNPIFNQQDLFDAMYTGCTFDGNNAPIVDYEADIALLENHLEFKFKLPCSTTASIEEFDKIMQEEWFMPKNYCPDLLQQLYDMCSNDDQRTRVSEELTAYLHHGMIDLLYYLKYLVDTMSENNILWGVGRGSSVASYVLFLIGVHNIDSMKYNLSWQEFLR